MKKLKVIVTVLVLFFSFLLLGCDLAVSNNFPYESSVKLAILFQFLIVLLTDIILGGGCLVGGFFLLYKGLTGNAIVTVEVNTIKATIINCSPGIFLIIAGVAILYLNKFSIKLGAEKIENKKGIKIILFLIIGILIVGALGFCIYGFLVTDSNNIKWLQKN